MVQKLAAVVLLLVDRNVGKVKEWAQTEEEILNMFKPNPEFDKARKDATLELVRILNELAINNPTMRFSQILQNYGFVVWDQSDIESNSWANEFYLEPVDLLKRVKEKLANAK